LALSEELQQQLSASRCGQSRRVWTRQSNTYHHVVSSSTWCTTLCICLQSPCVCLVSCTLCSDWQIKPEYSHQNGPQMKHRHQSLAEHPRWCSSETGN